MLLTERDFFVGYFSFILCKIISGFDLLVAFIGWHLHMGDLWDRWRVVFDTAGIEVRMHEAAKSPRCQRMKLSAGTVHRMSVDE